MQRYDRIPSIRTANPRFSRGPWSLNLSPASVCGDGYLVVSHLRFDSSFMYRIPGGASRNDIRGPMRWSPVRHVTAPYQRRRRRRREKRNETKMSNERRGSRTTRHRPSESGFQSVTTAANSSQFSFNFQPRRAGVIHGIVQFVHRYPEMLPP
ncbi:uncharacterized protein LOC125500768 [Athalia rosae]|uniref:uncharacterized protein LOC125500768 n=1 Tax=Athalia rosae TaxID=37344 RepID=UPI002034407E|nr:uncharacterized protein LOC125500768 [Athalia rosae]